MSKLIKLTTTLDRNRDTNGYIAICDNDIILQPNAKVSLLNAHLSSGILADYDITGTDTLGQVRQGEIVANIQLADTGDRERDIIIPNGSYGINPLLSQFQNSMNQAFVFNSTTQYATTTSAALNIPASLDFGIACQTSLDLENKTKIAFNSTQPKYTADLKYTNKNNGITIAPTGEITYTSATGAFQVTLDPTKATRAVVYTNNEIGTGIGVFDVVTLVNSTTGNSRQTTVTAIALDSTNVTNAIALDTAQTDAGAGVVVSDAAFTQTLPFQVGQDITIDDGAGVFGTPSANTAYGKIQQVELVLENPNYEMVELATEKIQAIAPTFAIHSIKPNPSGQNNSYVFDVACPYLLATDEHLAVDGLFYVLDATKVKYACCQVTDVKEHINPGAASSTDITVTVEALTANPLEEVNMKFVETAEFIYSTGGKTALDTPIKGQMGWFDKDYNLIGILYVDGDPTLENDNYVFELQLGGYECIDSAGALLNGLPAFLQFTKLTYGSVGFDINDVSITSVDRLITSAATNIAGFNIANADTGVVFQQGLINQYAVTVNAAPYAFVTGGAEYVIIPFEFTDNTFDKYETLFKALIPSANVWNIVKDNVNQNLKFTLSNLTGVALSPVLTRFWIGTDIVNTWAVTLNIAPASTIVTNQFDLLCKGTNSVGQENALCVEDSRLIPSCGRISFKIVTLGICEFGVMPESNDFSALTKAVADVRIKLQNNRVGQLVYTLWRAGTRIPLKTDLNAIVGDTVILQYGVTPSATDYEYNDNVNNGSDPATIFNNINAWTDLSTGTHYDEDRNKILVSVIRNGKTDTYIHLGCVLGNPSQSAGAPDDIKAGKCIPWTPRSAPFVAPQYWDNSRNYRIYVCPNTASIRPMELTPSPLVVTNSVTGIVSHFDGVNHIYNPDMHGSSNLELLALPPNKFGAYNNQFIFTFTSQTFQKILGYKTSSKAISGLSGSWVADISYLKAYLPEGIVVLLENLSIDTFDCGQFNGSRRNIIATCIDTQDKLGEISVEPSNLYRINIGNNTAVNLRKFALAFEDLFGNKLILQNSKVCVSLLFE